MTELTGVIQELIGWTQPPDSPNPFSLRNRFVGSSKGPVDIGNFGHISLQLAEFWSQYDECWLFEDQEYGQWGLHLLSSQDRMRMTDLTSEWRGHTDEDFVFGEFLGDLDLLIIGRLPSGEFGLFVAGSLDERSEWSIVGTDLVDFLTCYLRAGGEMLWSLDTNA